MRLGNFRNYERLDFVPAAGLNVLVGPNAQGKSNLLEALAMLATGKSFRAHRESELIRERRGARGDRRRGAHRGRRDSAALHDRAARRRERASVRGERRRSRLCAFSRPRARRDVRAGRLAARRRRTVAAALVSQRCAGAALADVLPRSRAVPERSCSRSRLCCAVRSRPTAICCWPTTTNCCVRRRRSSPRAARSSTSWRRRRRDLRALARDARTARRDVRAEPRRRRRRSARRAARAELRRRTTLVGPHRDDLRLLVDGKPLAAFGSQGQQRTAVLALKVAEYDVMRARTGDAPILLLDDVLSELDAERAAGFSTRSAVTSRRS